jgi:hypothetical protein
MSYRVDLRTKHPARLVPVEEGVDRGFLKISCEKERGFAVVYADH